ncbi:hypothetical protein Ciccas_001592 [Cichlidogyrus casuarinus]|uniref:ELP1 first N-terminal beta-propeller domain-containing protein n=1 Tax=Cichlidogyrus casuarinus TaxID=1844966 RepID=A0ABD2QK49_9PLAT
MTSLLEPLNSLDLTQPGFGIAKPVSVGWGKKETQFHGSAGKQAAFAEPESATDLNPWDDERLEIVWRDDGNYFAISYVKIDEKTSKKQRHLRTFDESGSLHATAEPTEGLDLGMDWQ